MQKKLRLKNLTPEEELTFRVPMQIMEIIVMDDGDAYPLCPRCDISFDGQYQKYCTYCGQCLKWTFFARAKVRRPLMPARKKTFDDEE